MPIRPLKPLLRVALPVAVAVVFVCLAIINIAIVKTYTPELEDGVRWKRDAPVAGDVPALVAVEIAPDSPGARAGIQPGDVVLFINDRDVHTPLDVVAATSHRADGLEAVTYTIRRAGSQSVVALRLEAPAPAPHGLYYSLALVGILSIVVGASVRLRRPADPATLHFFWLTVAFFGVLAFTPSGRYDRLDYFFDWSDLVARLVLPPLFLHFAFVFPERPEPWVRTDAGRAILPLLYLPALILGAGRALILSGLVRWPQPLQLLAKIEVVAYVYLACCLLGGLAIMMRALTRLRSVTARRQLRWIMWGSSVGAVPFVAAYVVPFLFGHIPPYTEYSAVLLGCIPLAFASALVRYRLMDIEVIIKKALVVGAVASLLALIYGGTRELVKLVLGRDQDSAFWGLFATLIVALVTPTLWNAIQAALDRLYYRDRYDYRRALVSFARELNSDLDLKRLSTRLVDRVRETLGIDRIAVFLTAAHADAGRVAAVAAGGFEGHSVPLIDSTSALAARLQAGHTVVIDDPLPARRFSGMDSTEWREAGLYSFVPCISNDTTIAVLAVGRRQQGEPLSSEDMTLLGAVAAQAATALENARLYGQLSGKADEIERLRQFGDSVVESLTDGLVVIDLDERVLRWNRRMEELAGVDRGRAVGREMSKLFPKPFVETLEAARRESPAGTTLYRVPLTSMSGDQRRSVLVNIAVSPFQTDAASHAGRIIVLEDITDRANIEEQLRLSEKMAAIGLLAAGVAHEVNTPLTGISSFTQMLLERSEPDDPKVQLLEKIERQTFRAAKIINSLLNLARPSSGEMAPVDLNVVINDVIALLEHQFKMGNVQVRKTLVAPGPVVRGFEYKLQQVFLNLFLNARDAMPKGGWLSIETVIDGDAVAIEVADTGMGIPSEHIARIYDPFFTTKPEGGTGLGLSVTYGIVQEHQGTLTCESDMGHGTRFRLVLPLMTRPAARGATASGG